MACSACGGCALRGCRFAAADAAQWHCPKFEAPRRRVHRIDGAEQQCASRLRAPTSSRRRLL
eukprot:scaffold36683_cov57-Phaeocystis_antarctica.AAC.2